METMEFVAPGEAIVEASVSWGILRLCSVLFGDMAAQVMTRFYDQAAPVAWHQMARRDYPMEGDSAGTFWMEDDLEKPHEYLILTRLGLVRCILLSPWCGKFKREKLPKQNPYVAEFGLSFYRAFFCLTLACIMCFAL